MEQPPISIRYDACLETFKAAVPFFTAFLVQSGVVLLFVLLVQSEVALCHRVYGFGQLYSDF